MTFKPDWTIHFLSIYKHICVYQNCICILYMYVYKFIFGYLNITLRVFNGVLELHDAILLNGNKKYYEPAHKT
jgi:hypothetical protein